MAGLNPSSPLAFLIIISIKTSSKIDLKVKASNINFFLYIYSNRTNMNSIVKTVLNALGIAFMGLFLVNFVIFLVAYFSTDFPESWSVALKHGSFRVNDVITGFKLWTTPANILLGVFFAVAMSSAYKRGKFNMK